MSVELWRLSASKPVRVAVVVDPTGDTAEPVRDALGIAATALRASGYAVEEAQPPAIDAAAKSALDMPAGDWQTMSPLLSQFMAPSTQRIWSGLLELAGDPDRATAMQSYITRRRCCVPGASSRRRIHSSPPQSSTTFPSRATRA